MLDERGDIAHAVDENSFPLDPELRRLEDHLGALAAEWRGSQEQYDHASGIVREYHATLERLIELGWDASVGELDYEDRLPDDLMPDAYLRRHKHLSIPSSTGE